MDAAHMALRNIGVRRVMAQQAKISIFTWSKNYEDTGQLRSIEDRLESPPVVEVHYATRRVCRAHYNPWRRAEHYSSVCIFGENSVL